METLLKEKGCILFYRRFIVKSRAMLQIKFKEHLEYSFKNPGTVPNNSTMLVTVIDLVGNVTKVTYWQGSTSNNCTSTVIKGWG